MNLIDELLEKHAPSREGFMRGCFRRALRELAGRLAQEAELNQGGVSPLRNFAERIRELCGLTRPGDNEPFDWKTGPET